MITIEQHIMSTVSPQYTHGTECVQILYRKSIFIE